MRLHTSPLAPELDASRADGTADVVALATGRRPTVRATRLPATGRELAFRRAMADLFDDHDVVHGIEVGDV